jgi:hypothetical protein
MLAPLEGAPDAMTGVAALVGAHLGWVVAQRRNAKFLFEQSRAEWLTDICREQQQENNNFRGNVANWFDPLVTSGSLREMPIAIFISQIIGPAQIFCRAWLSGRERRDPREYEQLLAQCAIRSVVTQEN